MRSRNSKRSIENVRGGIPILFPNAGPVDSSKYPNLKQHGFARDSSKWKSVWSLDGFKETLESDKDTLASYPYNFSLLMEGKFSKRSSH